MLPVLYDVIVVGAGPVGLSAALLLIRGGARVAVVEALDGLSGDLRASTFHPPTIDMLDALGVGGALVERGLPCPTWQVRLHATGEYAEFDLALLAEHTAHPYRLQCEQNILCELLAREIEGDSAGAIRFGWSVNSVRQTPERVQVIDAKGECLEARYLVGADGAASVVRESAGLTFGGTTYPETTVLVTTSFPFQEAIVGLANVSYCWREGGNFALLRLPGCWRASLYYDPAVTPVEAVSDAYVQGQLQAIVRDSGRFNVLDARHYRVHQRLVERYREGRVVLAGDAAHLNAPSGGMGMNGGIHDAFNLAPRLLRVLDGERVETLDQYSRQRRFVAEHDVQAQAARNRARMTQRGEDERRRSLADLQRITSDPNLARDHLLRSSMITGLRNVAAVV
jgi:2-polyprenyl-6-methoxyphenol hydroxylase-like FAD-dependent oxidoreductase